MSAPAASVAAPARVDVPAVATFLVVAFGAAWLITAPLWLDPRGLTRPLAGVFLVAMMLAPTLATLAVVFGVRRGPRADRRTALRTGLRAPGGIRPWLGWAVLAWLGPLVLVAASLLLATAAGTYHPDLVEFSGFRQVLRAVGGDLLPVSVGTLVGIQVVQAALLGFLNVVPALAEEWGWRGWLLPALLPLGRWPAVLLTGVVWGLWHTPVLLLGYNYPAHPPLVRVLLMVGFCVVTGTLLGWLRLRTQSVWPCAVGHGFVNATAGLAIVFAAAQPPVDNAQAGLLGWPGWVVCALAFALVAVLVRRRDRRVSRA